MIRAGLILCAIFVIPPRGFTQSTLPVDLPPSAQTDKIDPEIKKQFESWERVMRDAKNFSSNGVMTRKNMITKKVVETEYEMKCMKPNLGKLRLVVKPAKGEKANPNDFTTYICDGNSVFEYDGAAKTRTEYNLRGHRNMMLDFMSGSITADMILNRFEVKITKTDDYYLYYELRPKTPQDKADFDTISIVLFKPNLKQLAWLPATIRLRKNNNQEEEQWDFPQPKVNSKEITADQFKPETPPKDWTIKVKETVSPQPKNRGTDSPSERPRVTP